MNKIIYNGGRFVVKVKHLIFPIVIILILLFGLKSCANKDNTNFIKEKDLKVEKIVKKEFVEININQFELLLSSSNICSDEWYQELDSLLKVFNEQIDIYEKLDNKEMDDLFKAQKKLVDSIDEFLVYRSIDKVNILENSYNEYKQAVREGNKK